MKNTIQKSIDVISGLVQKCVVINNKVKQNILNQQNYSELHNRLNNLEKMFSDNIVGDSGDTPTDKVYKYTVSGAGTAEVNGNYWDTGELVTGYPSYENVNGVKIYCIVTAGIGKWVISQSVTGSDSFYSSYWNGDTIYNTLEECIHWYIVDGTKPLPTITKYNQNNGQPQTPDVPNTPDDGIDINDVLANPTEYAVVINGAINIILDGHGKPTGDEQDYSGTYDECDHHRAGIDEPVDPEEPDADYIVWAKPDYMIPWFIHDPNSICYGTKGHKWCIYLSGEILWYCDDEIPGPGSKWVWDYDHDGLYFAPGGDVSVKFIKK